MTAIIEAHRVRNRFGEVTLGIHRPLLTLLAL